VTRYAPRKTVNQRTGVLKLNTAIGKAYGAVIGTMDGNSRLARQKFTTEHEARTYRTSLQERYEVFELKYQLAQKLAERPRWRKVLDWLRVKLGREPYPPLLAWQIRDPSELDIAERQRMVKQIRGLS